MVVSSAAERDLKLLARKNRQDYGRVLTAICALTEDPRPPGSRKLSGRDAYRVRVGDYRVIYRVADNELVVEVLGIGHRREVYR